ncbi:MAG TPA: hypothetical protein VFN25_13680 [Dokdonella sp.]|uniref:hypothetical protein n=1 Tax=Dokdonella sp. TaxID=2291710 RepID=UPI002D80B6D3|nr:hypothetical protein [Dokdonella sp.]HET9033940.1 hypothetical protein [Dokdonella sp.]
MREHWDFFKESDSSMGVFYPLHYVLAAFDNEVRANEIRQRFLDAHFAEDNVAVVDGPFLADRLESLEGSNLAERAGQELVRAVGTELGYIDDDRKTAQRGGAFLFVYAPDQETTDRVIEILKFAHPIYARRYHRAGIHKISYPKQSVL